MKRHTALAFTLSPFLLGAIPSEEALSEEGPTPIESPQIQDISSTDQILREAAMDPCLTISFGVHALQIINGIKDLSPSILQRSIGQRTWTNDQGIRYLGTLDETKSHIRIQMELGDENVGVYVQHIDFSAGNDGSSELRFTIHDTSHSKSQIHAHFTTTNTLPDFHAQLGGISSNHSMCPSTAELYAETVRSISPQSPADK